jgi:5-methylcytosine-specific restriction protein A
MSVLRACVVCARPASGSYCGEHKPKPWATSRRRERMGLSGGAWETLRRAVLARDRGVCFLCDQLGADQVDHLVTVADGGTNELSNLASCHAACHGRKHREPAWAAERVAMALVLLGART